MDALAGIGVLVTRPESQAEALSQQLAGLGATVFRLPALDIRGRTDRAQQQSVLGPLARFDWVICISANAVQFGDAFLPTATATTPKLAAIGRATVAALARRGLAPHLVPATGFDSEHLLASPELQAVAGQRVLIVRGGGGRELLAETLRARGAEVHCADVYERVTATPAPGVIAAVEEAWARGAIQIVTVTSLQIARALYELLGDSGRRQLARATLLTGSTRIAQGVPALGLTGPAIVAAQPDDSGLVTALLAAVRRVRQPNESA